MASLHAQEYPYVEHVISDGASQDDTLRKIAEFHKNHETIVDSRLDGGVYEALNLGVERSTGDIVGILHADDTYNGSKSLTDVANAFQDEGTRVVFSDLVIVKNSKVIRRWCSSKYRSGAIFRGWVPPHPTVFVRRDLFDEIGPYLTSFRIAGDYEFLIRLFKRVKPSEVKYLPVLTYRMEVGGLSTRSGFNALRKRVSEDLSVLRIHFRLYLVPYFLKIIRKIPQFFRN